MQTGAIDQAKLEALSGKVMGDISGAMGLYMSYIGDQSGVYTALEEHGPGTVEQLAAATDLNERYLHEWLSANAALGYVTYDPANEAFHLTPEQAAVFAHDGEPTCMQGFFQSVMGQFATYEKAVETFQSGRGRPWEDHHECCFCGTDRFFRPGYVANLVENWIPALTDTQAKLEAGGTVADIGCGHGSSTILLAEQYPQSTIHGYDFHAPSIEAAKKKALDAGLTNVEFFVSDAKAVPDNDYDFACIFDALHDMGDPVGVLPAFGKSSTAGFSSIRRATETTTNMVLEARA